MKKLLLFLMLILPLSIISFGQIDDEDAQLFGSKRDAPAFNQYNFGHITDQVVQHQFTLKNATPSPMTIISIDAPEGVGVTLVNKVIEPKTVGKFVVTLRKKYLTKGDFIKHIKITVEQEDALGKKTIQYDYTISGNL
jgi:hypothetical protein